MSLRVLAIDDSLTIRTLLSEALKEAGFYVNVAVDGEDGVKRFNDVQPDVIITDINMPKLDGFGVIEKIRSSDNNNTVPILVLTTESSPELKMKARSAGASGWIVKPFSERSLISALRRVTGY